ncbi:hypothetical protein A2U01_0073316, partial [Trifolium medium]|nr:hypothetical protein [Trifolium medium]
VATSVSEKEKIVKKQKTQKKRAPRARRNLVIHEKDDEETDEEPLQQKRKRTVTDKDQPEPKKMTTEAKTGISHSPKNDVTDSQALPLPENEIDIDPAL